MEILIEDKTAQKPQPLPEWLTNQLTEQQAKNFSNGRSIFSESLIFPPDNQSFTGRIQIGTDKGEPVIRYLSKQQKLIIPKEIDGELLTKDQLKKLNQGEFILLANGLFIHIDKQLNRVVIKSEIDLQNINYVGDHKLTPQEKLDLLNGKSLTISIKDPKSDRYILTTFKATDNVLTFDMNNTKYIKKEDHSQFKETTLYKTTQSKTWEQLVNEFLDGNDKTLVDIKKYLIDHQQPPLENILRLADTSNNPRTQALLSQLNLNSQSIHQLKEISIDKTFHLDNKEHSFTAYDIRTSSITSRIGEDKFVQIPLSTQIRTKTQQQTHIQQMSMSRTPQKAAGLSKI